MAISADESVSASAQTYIKAVVTCHVGDQREPNITHRLKTVQTKHFLVEKGHLLVVLFRKAVRSTSIFHTPALI